MAEETPADEDRELFHGLETTLLEMAELAEQEAIRLGAEGDYLGEYEARGISVARKEAGNRLGAILELRKLATLKGGTDV
jgi:hypothetical protein